MNRETVMITAPPIVGASGFLIGEAITGSQPLWWQLLFPTGLALASLAGYLYANKRQHRRGNS